MASLRSKNTAPPGGYKYFQAETRLWIKGHTTLQDTAWAMSAHRAYKALPRSTYQECVEDLENQLCERLGSAFCKGVGERKDFSQNIDASQAVAFSKAFIKHAAGGFEFAPIEEAKTRAEGCRNCFMNMERGGCSACGPLVALIESAIPAERRFPGLEMCGACGCSLVAKVNATKDVIKSADKGRELTYPNVCWVKDL